MVGSGMHVALTKALRWLTRFSTLFVATTPHRQDVRDRFAALPALPEADRMRHSRKATRTPKSLAEWNLLHGRKRAG